MSVEFLLRLVKHGRKELVTASADGTIRVWNMATGRQLKLLRDGASIFDDPAAIAPSRDDRSLVAAIGYKPKISVWNVEDGTSTDIASAAERLFALAYSADDQSILAFGEDGILRRWNSRDRRVQHELSLESLLEPAVPNRSNKEMFTAGTFFAGARKLAAVTSRRSLRVVDVASGKESARVGDAKLVAVSPDEKTIAITRNGSNDTYKRMGDDGNGRFVETNATIVLVEADTCREKHDIEVAGSASGPWPSPPTASNSRRDQRLGNWPDSPLRGCHWEGIPQDRDPGDPHPGLDVHARRFEARLRHG